MSDVDDDLDDSEDEEDFEDDYDWDERDEEVDDEDLEEDDKESGDYEADSDDDYEELMEAIEDNSEEEGYVEHCLTEAEVAELLAAYGTYQPEIPLPGRNYTAFCWGEDRAGLSEQTHRRCQQCGWLICRCGKCWCNMPPRKKAMYKVHVKHIAGAVECHACRARPVTICSKCSGSTQTGTGGCSECREGVVYCSACDGRGFTRVSEGIPF
jgi:hypothetical protein